MSSVLGKKTFKTSHVGATVHSIDGNDSSYSVRPRTPGAVVILRNAGYPDRFGVFPNATSGLSKRRKQQLEVLALLRVGDTALEHGAERVVDPPNTSLST